MTKKDKASIQTLAAEGKQITKILAEDFPEYEYIEIYEAASDSTWKTTQGVKRSITKRLKTLTTTRKKPERIEIIEELSDLTCHLYDSLTKCQRKLSAIRKTLDK